MKNYKKNLKYAELSEKLKSAIENEFYYEAIFIEYAILEDRTESILRHANVERFDEKGNPMNLNSKLKAIENNIKFQNDYVKKHLPRSLIKQIHAWKSQRNDIIHDLINSEYDNNDIKALALEGKELVKIITNKSTLINNYNKKTKIPV